MTLTLHLPPELEQRLNQEAQRQGLSLDEYTLALLDKSLPPKDWRTELITLLQIWIDEEDPPERSPRPARWPLHTRSLPPREETGEAIRGH
jgi:hypothetical protein